MSNEVNIQELLAELEMYRWKDKKALILKKFGYRLHLGSYDREEKLKAYKEQKWLGLMKTCFIIEEADELMSQGYTFDEILRAIKEYIAEALAEEKENE